MHFHHGQNEKLQILPLPLTLCNNKMTLLRVEGGCGDETKSNPAIL